MNSQENSTENNNSNNVADIKLTPAELELIRIQRDEKELAKQKLLAEFEVEKSKELEKQKKILADRIEKTSKINELTKSLCAELNKIAQDKYCIFSIPTTAEIVVYLYVTETKKELLNLSENKLIIETLRQESENLYITRSDLSVSKRESEERSVYDYQIYISVIEHYTSSGSYRYSSSKFAGYKYQVCGRIIDSDDSRKKYTKAQSVHETVSYAIDRYNRKTSAEEKAKIAKATCIEFVQKQYPDAKQVKEETLSSHFGSKTYYNYILAELKNSLKVYYSYSYDGKTFDFKIKT